VWDIGGMILTGKTEVLGDGLSQFFFFNHKSHMDLPGIEPGVQRCEAGS
jgi:hypothetical protein